MRERLCQFDLFRPIAWPLTMAKSDKSPDATAHQRRNPEEFLRSSGIQVFAKLRFDIRIMFHVLTDHRHSGKKQVTKSAVLLPGQRIFDERMLRIGFCKVCALGPGPQNERLI